MDLRIGDARDLLPTLDTQSVQTIVTSPPYWRLRDYGHPGQLGQEPTAAEYVANLVSIFALARRVLRRDGTLWLNLGDCYAGQPGGGQGPSGALAGRTAGRLGVTRTNKKRSGHLKRKDLVGIPWRVALALQEDGWYLRSDIVWVKPNAMPENVHDRPTRSHEYVFLLSRCKRYYYDEDALAEPAVSTHASGNGYVRPERQSHGRRGNAKPWAPRPMRRGRDVWTVPTQSYTGAHFGVMAPEIAERCIRAGSRVEDLVMDPFAGVGTTAGLALRHGRRFVGCELVPHHAELARHRALALAEFRSDPLRICPCGCGLLVMPNPTGRPRKYAEDRCRFRAARRRRRGEYHDASRGDLEDVA